MTAQTNGETDYQTSPTLEEWTRGVVASMLSVAPEDVFRHEDGSFLLGRGSAAIWVQPLSDPSHLWIHSWMVTDVEPHAELLAMLNQININIPIGTVAYLDRAVRISHALLAGRLDHDDVCEVIRMVAETADFYDHKIQERFGGKIAYYEPRGDEIDV